MPPSFVYSTFFLSKVQANLGSPLRDQDLEKVIHMEVRDST